MNKRLLSNIGMHQVRSALFILFLFIAINLVWIARGQPPASNTILSNSNTSSNRVRSVNGVKTVVRVHDGVERPQIALPQQNNSLPVLAPHRYYLWRGVPCSARPSGP